MNRLLPLIVLVVACAEAEKATEPSDTEAELIETEVEDTEAVVDSEAVADSEAVDDTEAPAETDEPVDTEPPAPASAPLYTTDYNLSGSRLTAHLVEDNVGNTILGWFYDEQLDVRCTPQLAGDGVMRCLPEAIPLGAGLFSQSPYFGDASCTAPVELVGQSCPGVGYFLRPFESLTEVYTSAGFYPNVYELGRNGACVASTRPAGTASIGAVRVEPSTFVGFTRTSLTITGDYGVQLFQGEDGSQYASGLYHTGAPGGPAQVYNGRLVPLHGQVNVTQLVYASCGDPVPNAVVLGSVDFTPAYVSVTTEFPPPRPPAPWLPPITEILPVLSTQSSYCELGQTYTASAGQTVFVLDRNNPTPESSFPETLYVGPTSTGVQFAHRTTPGGTYLLPVSSVVGGGIAFNGVGAEVAQWDGGLVRLPAEYLEANLFGNSNCTQPVYETNASPVAVGFPFLEFVNTTATASCSYLAGVPREVQALFTHPGGSSPFARSIYLRGGDGSCFEAGQTTAVNLTDATAQATTLLPSVPLVDGPLAP